MGKVFLNEHIEVPPTPEGPGDDGNGVNSFIYRGEEMSAIQDKYGRTGCCLKIFKNREKFRGNPNEQWWGPSHPEKGNRLTEATHIQNIYASEGLAPRVYALFQIKINNKWHWAQLTDDLGHCIPDAAMQDFLIKGQMQEVADKYGITIFNDGREWNVVNGKYVDFQAFHLTNDYEEKLKTRLVGVANVGKWGPFMNYHSIPKLGIKGGRKNRRRVRQMGLKEADFKDKTVLDIGCSEGFFCRYASDMGAKRVTGVDLPGVVEPTRELCSYLGYYNMDFIGVDLKTDKIEGQFDIVFFFSMGIHIGFPDWVSDTVLNTLIFEGNGKGEDVEIGRKIADKFPVIIEYGETTDLFNRPVIWARR